MAKVLLIKSFDDTCERSEGLYKKLLKDAKITDYLISVATNKTEYQSYVLDLIESHIPYFILTLGAVPTKTILKTTGRFASQVGKIYTRDFTSAYIIPMYTGNFLLQRSQKYTDDALILLKKIAAQVERYNKLGLFDASINKRLS